MPIKDKKDFDIDGCKYELFSINTGATDIFIAEINERYKNMLNTIQIKISRN